MAEPNPGAKPAISWQAAILRSLLHVEKRLLSRRFTPIATSRKRLKLIEPFVPGPPRGTRTIAVDAGGVAAVQVAVHQARSDRCVLFFHGGGYAIGTPRLYRDFLWRIGVAARAHVLYFDYRLAPEHPFPAALDDAIVVYRWLVERFDPRHIAFFGDSAGGGLALAALQKLRDEAFALPAAAAAASPWTDLALTAPSLQANAAADPMMDAAKLPGLARSYAAGADPRNPYISPLYGNPAGLPPTLIQVGSDEILRDDAVRMAEKMRLAGCDVHIEVWPKMPHVWQLYARLLPEGRDAIERIGAFLRTRI